MKIETLGQLGESPNKIVVLRWKNSFHVQTGPPSPQPHYTQNSFKVFLEKFLSRGYFNKGNSRTSSTRVKVN